MLREVAWQSYLRSHRPVTRTGRSECSQRSRRPLITAPRARIGDLVETLLTVDAARTFAGRPESARAARVWAVSHLPSGSPVADDVALMVSDLVTHALHYSRSGLPGGSVIVRLKIGSGRVRVDVIDEGADSRAD